jgi:trans-aconitate 2-methyltransferase
LPASRIIALDVSTAMMIAARAHLAASGGRIDFVQADAAALPFRDTVDVIFSTATFHWVADHPRLFRSLYRALKAGGRLVAQCAGGPNLATLRERAAVLMRAPLFAPWFRGWKGPWEYADADTTAERLHEAGFINPRARVFPKMAPQPDAASYREFIRHVVCRPYLLPLPTAALRDTLLDELVAQAALDAPPFHLDYWRLNIFADKQ